MRILKKILLLFVALFLMSSCGNEMETETLSSSSETEKEEVEIVPYISISAQEAKQLMDTEADYVILDVRTEEEFAEGRIPGAILIPDYEIKQRAESILTDKTQLILVYCRSGRRSKLASADLADMGYQNVKEFGGIIDWPYEIEK